MLKPLIVGGMDMEKWWFENILENVLFYVNSLSGELHWLTSLINMLSLCCAVIVSFSSRCVGFILLFWILLTSLFLFLNSLFNIWLNVLFLHGCTEMIFKVTQHRYIFWNSLPWRNIKCFNEFLSHMDTTAKAFSRQYALVIYFLQGSLL